MNRAIGLFDSGVGGLTVLNTISSLLPNENIIYVGDNKNCPYGNKTKEQLFEYAKKIIEYFIQQNVKLIVLACNTTSANVLQELRIAYPEVKIIGVIDATITDFIFKNKRNVLIIATQATIQSKRYEIGIQDYQKNIEVKTLATPKLVPLVESGQYKEGIYDVLHEYLDIYTGWADSIILGCTHYPILKEQIKRILPNIEYISSSEAIGSDVLSYLQVNHCLNQVQRSYCKIYTTGSVDEFICSSSGFFDYTHVKVEYLDLD